MVPGPMSQRETVLKLMEERSKIEEQLKELQKILDKNHVGMNEPLIDEEGFPRNDIEVYQVRHARNQIICLQNDARSLMKKLEDETFRYFDETNPNHSVESNNSANSTNSSPMDVPEPLEPIKCIPFVRVTRVDSGSPAELAGICMTDEIVEFGSINITNFKGLADIASAAQHAQGRALPVKILRNGATVVVNLIPRPWVGKGLIGCSVNVIPDAGER